MPTQTLCSRRAPAARFGRAAFGLLFLSAFRGAVAADSAPPASAGPAPTGATVVLNPFEIQADSDKSYGVLNSHSITAFNTALDHVPVTADIFDQSFMDDVGAINVEAAIQSYDAGAQFGALAAGSPGSNQPGDHYANGTLRLRGAPVGGMQFNGLLIAGSLGNPGGTGYGSTSNFDLERLEVVDGPQSLLFSGGGPGGVINLVTKEARIGQPTFGDMRFRTDQFGSKYATFDYGASEGHLAIRVALVDGAIDNRRVNIGERIFGQYLQFAAQLGNTIFRLSLQQSVDTRTTSDYHTLTSSSGDPLFQDNGDHLEYLLATGQAGAIDNGNLNWNNVESFDGEWAGDHEVAEFATFEANTKWTNWLSTQFSVAAGNFEDDQIGAGGTVNLYTPNASSNPMPGNWTMGMPSSSFPAADQWRPKHNKAIRFSGVLTNELFGGKANSMTNFAADYTGNYNRILSYSYYLADSSWNVLTHQVPPTSTDPGRTKLPTQAWTVNNGPVFYSLFNPGVQRITLNGNNYVRQKENVDPANGGQNGDFASGYAVVNDTQWLDGKLDTLAGFRIGHEKNWSGGPPSEKKNVPDFSLGSDYHLLPWLAPYFLVSDVWATAGAQNAAPDGTLPPICHAVAEEAGFKVNTLEGGISGSISAYRNVAKDNQFNSGGNLASYVSPNGLNGQVLNGTGANFTSDLTTYGITAAITAAPTKNWRIRLSAAITSGKFGKGVAFGENYNDQFHEDASGNVTYADGTVVYVPAAFNSKQLTVPAGTAGAVPLTVTLLSTPGSPYFAAPQPVNGAILKTSNGGLALLSVADPVHGSILTGQTGLPISSYQLNPALSGVTPIGTLYAVQSGDLTWGYPADSANLTSVYEFSNGWIKGFKIGGTVSVNTRQITDYYYPNGFTGSNFSDERPFYLPTKTQFDLITGYTHKFRHVTWSTQINVNNIFNHYHLVIFPDVTTGWTKATALTANLDTQPRYVSWTNSIDF